VEPGRYARVAPHAPPGAGRLSAGLATGGRSASRRRLRPGADDHESRGPGRLPRSSIPAAGRRSSRKALPSSGQGRTPPRNGRAPGSGPSTLSSSRSSGRARPGYGRRAASFFLSLVVAGRRRRTAAERPTDRTVIRIESADGRLAILVHVPDDGPSTRAPHSNIQHLRPRSCAGGSTANFGETAATRPNGVFTITYGRAVDQRWTRRAIPGVVWVISDQPVPPLTAS